MKMKSEDWAFCGFMGLGLITAAIVASVEIREKRILLQSLIKSRQKEHDQLGIRGRQGQEDSLQ